MLKLVYMQLGVGGAGVTASCIYSNNGASGGFMDEFIDR